MHGISKNLSQEIREKMQRPEGTVTLDYHSDNLFNDKASGSFLLQKPKESNKISNLKFGNKIFLAFSVQ